MNFFETILEAIEAFFRLVFDLFGIEGVFTVLEELFD